jgi:hypothetical protein
MNGSYNHARRTGVTKRLNVAIALIVASLVPFPFDGLAWNIPGHMLSGAIAYQILQRENPSTIPICALWFGEELLVRDALETTIGETAGYRT